MDFARKILENYGWKEGDGLGKHKNGIAKPLKACLKFDNAGFGADQAADDFNNHWWERVFNEAATNVNVSREGESVKMSLRDEETSVEISTKGYSMKKLKKLKKDRGDSSATNGYDNFLRAATFTSIGGEIENVDKINTHDIEVSKINVLSDEELFKACGGRTAHKGARHGLKLSGKLSRIEQQEAELLAKMMSNRKGFIDDKLIKDDVSINSITAPVTFTNQNEKECRKDKLKKKKRKHSEKSGNGSETTELAIVKSKKEKGFNKECNDIKTPNVSSILDRDNHEEESFLNEAKKNKNSGCLEEKSSKKKKRKNKEKFLG